MVYKFSDDFRTDKHYAMISILNNLIINAIEALSGLSGHSASPAPVKRRKMSAAGRKAIAAAARARWAKIKAQKAGKVTVVAAKPAKKKRTISAAARAAMAAGSKARWAKIKAAKKKTYSHYINQQENRRTWPLNVNPVPHS